MTVRYPKTFDRAVFRKELGARIRHYRRAKRGTPYGSVTQAALAGELGITRAGIANIESGRQGCTVDRLWCIARILNVPIAKLIPAARYPETKG